MTALDEYKTIFAKLEVVQAENEKLRAALGNPFKIRVIDPSSQEANFMLNAIERILELEDALKNAEIELRIAHIELNVANACRAIRIASDE